MIIEDENGREWTTDELRDWDREPDEPEPEPPLDLDKVETDWNRAMKTESVKLGPDAENIMFRAVPQLLAELRAARVELNGWRGLTVVEHSYGVTEDGQPPAAGRRLALMPHDQANEAAAVGLIVWAKTTYTTGWERHTAPC